MASHLNSGRLNLGVLRENYRRELLEILDKYVGSKGLVWDDALTGPFGLIAEYTLLKEHEVEKMFPLAPAGIPRSNVQNVVFITRPKLSLMNVVADAVRKEEAVGGFRKEFHLIFVPRKSLLCEKKLKELGVYGTFMNVDEYALEFIPFDNDLLSMEMESSFRECYVENDFTSMHQVAKSLMTLQALYGIIPTIHGKGDCAKHVTDMLLRMRRELAGSTCDPQITPQIDSLLILDRSVDLLTPLLSQLTYEGLIDELFGIQNTGVKLPPEKFVSNSAQGGPVEVPTEPKKFILNSAEELYAELRDKNFNAVGPVLSKQAKFITAQFDERHSAKTVGEIKQFVSKLPHMQAAKASLATHTSIAELIKEVTDSEDFMECLRCQQEFINAIDTDKPNPFIEDCIARQEPLIKVLRLVCLQCVCNTGFKQKVLDYYKREIIQTYGFEHMITLVNLEKAGLLRVQGVHKTYTTLLKTLNLIVEDVNEQNPSDVAYVFSGYAPVSVRLAQHLAKNNWRSISEMLTYLPGPTISEVQKIPVGLRKRRSSITSSMSSLGDQKVTLVVFLGGVTYAEIAALRFLSQQEDGPTDYIIATTKIVNGSSWLNRLCDKLEAKPVNPF